MCGIMGYTGKKNAIPIVISGLKNLEYRGYDSAGIAYIKNKNQLSLSLQTTHKSDELANKSG